MKVELLRDFIKWKLRKSTSGRGKEELFKKQKKEKEKKKRSSNIRWKVEPEGGATWDISQVASYTTSGKKGFSNQDVLFHYCGFLRPQHAKPLNLRLFHAIVHFFFPFVRREEIYVEIVATLLEITYFEKPFQGMRSEAVVLHIPKRQLPMVWSCQILS